LSNANNRTAFNEGQPEELTLDSVEISTPYIRQALIIASNKVDPGYDNYIRVTVGAEADNTACLATLKEVLGH